MNESGYESVAQEWCSVCGTTHGRMEIHHIIRRSQGGTTTRENLVTLCRTCHKLTDGGALRFYRDPDDALWWEQNYHFGRCVFADPNRDEASPERMSAKDGEALASLEQAAVIYMEDANSATWKASKQMREAYCIFRDTYPGREGMRRYKEWAGELRDEDGDLRPVAPSTARDMALTAALPDECGELTLRERVRVVKALEHGADYDAAVGDIYALSREDFEAKYLGKPTWIERDK